MCPVLYFHLCLKKHCKLEVESLSFPVNNINNTYDFFMNSTLWHKIYIPEDYVDSPSLVAAIAAVKDVHVAGPVVPVAGHSID